MRYRLVLILVLSFASFVGTTSLPSLAGQTLFPDLQTLPPTDLEFDRFDDGTWVLRFTNTVANRGKGPLELQGEPEPAGEGEPIYQNLYDANGTRVRHKRVATDVIYHPQHQHYHFTDFGASVLLARDAGSSKYRQTTMKGDKTSFCVEDIDQVSGSDPREYTACSTERQGISPGWADIYPSTLAGQWVILGTKSRPLEDGEYALQSTADPLNLLDEGKSKKEHNNTGVTYFTVSGGEIRNVRDAP